MLDANSKASSGRSTVLAGTVVVVIGVGVVIVVVVMWHRRRAGGARRADGQQEGSGLTTAGVVDMDNVHGGELQQNNARTTDRAAVRTQAFGIVAGDETDEDDVEMGLFAEK